MKILQSSLLAATALLVAAPLAGAQTTGRLTATDQTFLRQDARGSAYELQISQLAAQRASNQSVRQYARMVVNDHDSYNQALRQVGQRNGVALPTSLTGEQQHRVSRLQSLNGVAFDNAYVRDVRQANAGDIRDSAQEEKTTQAPQIKQFIAQFRQLDEKHLQGAQGLPLASTANG